MPSQFDDAKGRDQALTQRSENIGTSRPVRARTGRLAPIDFAELKTMVNMQQVLELLSWRAVGRRGLQLRGPCPVHRSTSEKSRTFSANVERNIFFCFKPSCDAKGSQLDLYALVTGQPLLEAAYDLCQRLAIVPPILKTAKRSNGSRTKTASIVQRTLTQEAAVRSRQSNRPI